jgi:hypothetical protein
VHRVPRHLAQRPTRRAQVSNLDRNGPRLCRELHYQNVCRLKENVFGINDEEKV